MPTSPSRRTANPGTAAKSAKAAPARAPARKRAANGTAAPVVATELAAEVSSTKPAKHKLVRDSFTIPRNEYSAIPELKLRLAKLGRISKKSEVLRAGLKVLAAMPDASLKQALEAVPSIKTGRPKGKRKPATPHSPTAA